MAPSNPGGIRTCNPSMRAATDPRVRPRAHRKQTFNQLQNTYFILINLGVI